MNLKLSLFPFVVWTGNPNPIQVASNVSRYRIDNLEPYTMYKIVMSVQTQFGEGQSSDPVLNRTAEGRT